MGTSIGEATRPLEPQRRAIVVGASSGIGASLVEQLASSSHRVAAVARRKNLLDELCERVNVAHGDGTVQAYCHDVKGIADVPELFRTITRDMGGLDLIVYVAGIQPAVGISEFNTEKDAATIQTNLIGAIAWLNEAATRFERSRSGHIVGISSIAGDRGRVASPAYNTSKAGLNTYLEALRNRLSRHGIVVTTIKPGFVDTINLENAARTFWVISPEEAARQIYRAIQRQRMVTYIPGRWGLLGLVIRHIPSFIFRRLSF